MTIEEFYGKSNFHSQNFSYHEEGGKVRSITFVIDRSDCIEDKVKDEILEFVGQFKYLECLFLDIADYCFTDLSPLGGLHNLKYLTILCDTQITDLSFLKSIHKLESITLKHSRITHLEELYKNTQLTNLEITNAQLSDVSNLHVFKSLKCLDLSGNKIKYLGDKPFSLHLTEVNLAFNQIEDISPLEHCTKLTHVNLNTNAIGSIQPLTAADGLIHLNVDNNKIIDPSPLTYFKKLTTLNISNNAIDHISVLEDTVGLQKLYIENTRIDSIHVLENHHKLTELNIANNAIKDISVIEASKQTLIHLNCSLNPIASFAVLESLDALTHLNLSYIPLNTIKLNLPLGVRDLNVSNCYLTTLANIQPLNQIFRLNASYNLITEFTAESKSVSLSELNLSNNQIEAPINIAYIHRVSILDLRNNTYGNCVVIDKEYIVEEDLKNMDFFCEAPVMDTHSVIGKVGYNNLALEYYFYKKDKAMAWTYLLQIEEPIEETKQLQVVMLIDKFGQIPDGDYKSIKFYLYQIVRSVIGFYGEDVGLTYENKEILVNKIRSIKKSALRIPLFNVLNGESTWLEEFKKEAFPGYEFICSKPEDIAPEFIADYYYYLGLGRCYNYNNFYRLEADYIETSLYCLHKLYVLQSPLFDVLYNRIHDTLLIFGSGRKPENYDKFRAYKKMLDTIDKESISPIETYNYSGFNKYTDDSALKSKLNLLSSNKKKTIDRLPPKEPVVKKVSQVNNIPRIPRERFYEPYSPYNELFSDRDMVLLILFFIILFGLKISKFF